MCGKHGCTFKHHRLLHNDSKDKRPATTSAISAVSSPEASNTIGNQNDARHTCNTHRGDNKTVLFQYIPVTLRNQDVKIRTYAFLDLGSSVTLLEESLASKLQLKGQSHPLCLRWNGDACRYEDSATTVALDISGSFDEERTHRLSEVYTVKELKLPSQTLSFEELSKKHDHLRGLPIDSYSNVQPRILIGI